MKIYAFFLTLIAATLLSACATQPNAPRQVELGSEKVFYLDRRKSEASTDDILAALKRSIYQSSSVAPFKREKSSETFDTAKGLVVDVEPDELVVTYFNGTYNRSTQRLSGAPVVARYAYRVEETNDAITITIVPPSTLEVKKGLIGQTLGSIAALAPYTSMLEPQPLLQGEALDKDLLNITNNLSATLLHPVGGELNVSYRDDAVYANFQRVMGPYRGELMNNDKDAITKENVFALQNGNATYPLKVSVYPYRSGSKVTYKFYVPFKLMGDRSNDLRTHNLRGLKTKIASVAND